jgi:hypothetical protein
MEFAVVVEGNGGTNDKSILEGQISARVADVTEVLLKGRTIKWVSKSRGREQLSIEWKVGIRDDGYVPEQVTYADQKYRTCARPFL